MRSFFELVSFSFLLCPVQVLFSYRSLCGTTHLPLGLPVKYYIQEPCLLLHPGLAQTLWLLPKPIAIRALLTSVDVTASGRDARPVLARISSAAVTPCS